MKVSWNLRLVAFVVLVSVPVNRANEKNVDHQCANKLSCGACISADPKCSWCKQEEYGKYAPRCDTRKNLISRNCAEIQIISPKSSYDILKDLPLSKAKVKTNTSYVQMKPQKIHLKLRPRETISFPVVFRQAEDYPLDLYYLMDLTYSMRDDKEKLFELGDKLVDSISILTSNFRLGFGSFVDKVVLPYVNTVPSKLENPCLDDIICAPPYGFKNHMPLSNNRTRFTNEVQNAEISANLDGADGGFDAIMQVMVCKEQIDWREKSRKIVLFATDSGFHYAGDGKLGGIVVPNDGKCHLDEKGFYTMSTKQDYPSLSQISRKVKDNKVSIIFAVPDSQFDVYSQLSDAIEGAHTRELAVDSSNIVDLVRKQYNELSSEVELRVDNLPDYVRVSFSADCPGGTKGKHLCKGLKVGTTVKFNVSFTLEDCPKSAVRSSHEFDLYPKGLSEILRVQLEMLCECDCEMPDQEIENSAVCSYRGTYECGVCTCNEKYFGRSCECNSTTVNQQMDDSSCRVNNDSAICSNRGQCNCGFCECDVRPNLLEVISGPQCQCDNFTCFRDEKQQICGGPERGICECMQCVCKSEWSGKACTCSTLNDTCYNKGELCSGKGTCECGQCSCFEEKGKGRFGGKFCDKPPVGLHVAKCDDFQSCAECTIWKTGQFSSEECENNCPYNITSQSKLEDNGRLCVFQDREGCTFRFTYSVDDQNKTKPAIIVLDNKDCPQTANVLPIVLGVAGGVLVAGLLITLIIKLCIYLKDRRDYARFLEDVGKTTWGQEQNPLYKAAISNYTNPTYGAAKPAL